ncbi:rRNA pseudouridine-1189 N-methylase Emg1 (Nep1/Mra1 family), partial [Paraburkholderia sp. GAS42]
MAVFDGSHGRPEPDITYMVASLLQGDCAWRGGWLRTYIRTRSREVPA